MNDDTRERLAALEKRLARIEQLLGVSESAPPIQLGPPPVPPVYVEPARAAQAGPVDSSEPIPVIPIEEEILPLPPLPAAAQSAYPPPPIPPSKTDIEQTIGLKWAGWIGAVALVIGAAMGIKYAVDQGWLGHVPPTVRLMLMYAGGFAILAAGEVVYRRINIFSAAAVFGAGVATLFVVSYAGHSFYKLYSPEMAFVLMILSTLIGAAVAVRGKLVSIAILSLIGGNIAPLVLGESGKIESFLTYLLMLQIVALVLAWWGASGKWWILRTFSLISLTLWMIGVMATPKYDAAGAPLTFSLIYAALFQIELIVSSFRSRGSSAGGVTFSMFVTAGATIAMLYAFRHESQAYRGAWVIGFAILCAALGWSLSLRASDAAGALAIGFRLQGAALVAVAVPVALSGPWVSVAWGVLALAFALVGRTFDLNLSRVAAVVIWALALTNLCHWADDFHTSAEARKTLFHLIGEPVPTYFLLALILSLIGNAIAVFLLDRQSNPSQSPFSGYRAQTISQDEWARVVAAAAALTWGIASIAAFPVLGATAWIVGYAWLALLMYRAVSQRLAWEWHAIAAILLAAVKWMIVDTLRERFMSGWSADEYQPVFNPAIATGLLIAVSLVAIYVSLRRRLAESSLSNSFKSAHGLLAFLLLLMLLWMGSLEIDRYFEVFDTVEARRAKQMWLSIFWGLYAIGCVIAGFRWRNAGLRYFGLGLFALTLVKVVFIDLAHIGQGYRILSFMGLGVLLLGTSVLYGKLSPRLLKED